VFPGARNKYGDPIYVDDVAVDFPKLKILLAHGGRPLWMDTAFFLIRAACKCYLDISGIPPKKLLEYFPRLEEIAAKTRLGRIGRTGCAGYASRMWMISARCRFGKDAGADFFQDGSDDLAG